MLKDRRIENPEARRRLGALKPMKALIMPFLKIVSSLAPGKSDDRDGFEIWFDDLLTTWAQTEISQNPWTASRFNSIKKSVMAVIQTDKPYHDASVALVALARLGPRPPYSQDDLARLQRLGIEVR